jgi:intein/homing endonuclease
MMSTVSEVIEQGGCLTKDTLVNTKNGLFYFGELIKDTKEGWYPQELVVKTKDGDKNSLQYFVNGLSDIIRIGTDSGFELKGTPNHKVYILTQEGLKWIEFKDVHKGDYIVHKMDLHEGSCQSLYNNLPEEIHHNCIVPEKLPQKIDEGFAFFLGYFMGNGFSTSKDGDHRIGVTIPLKSYLIDKIESIIKDLFGNNISVLSMEKNNDQSRTYYISNKIIKEYLAINGLLKHKSIDACIPIKIRCSERNIVGSYLSGLFEADGSLCHKYPMLNSTSFQLIKEVQVLLMGLGIPSRVSQLKRSCGFSDTPIFCLKVSSFKGVERWNQYIKSDNKSRFYSTIVFEPDLKKEQSYILPCNNYWLKEALSAVHKEDKYLVKHIKRYLRGDRNFTLSAYISLIIDYPYIEEYLPAIDDMYFSKVTSLENDKDFTVDMEVEETHSYVANSLISHNSRRGANLGLLEVGHPDIWEFISFKNEHNWDKLKECVDVKDEDMWASFKFENLYKLQMYNISVGINDEFLNALKNDDTWPLYWKDTEWLLYSVIYKKDKVKFPAGENRYTEKIFQVTADCDKTALWKVRRKVPFPKGTDTFEITGKRKIKAKEIWDKICYNAWADGCPGILNISTIRKMHNLEYVSPFSSVNPCGEQLLGKYCVCNLSSIVLPSFVDQTSKNFDFLKFKEVIHTSVRFADDVIDNCTYPIPEIKDKAEQERRVGLGTMGVHDMLIEMGLGYDTGEGRECVENIMRFFRDEAYRASIELAKEKGSFKLFDKDKYMESGFIQTLPEGIREQIALHGTRCSTLITQAPTGTTGTMYNLSTGCEPWPFLMLQRNTRLGSYEDGCPAYIRWRKDNPTAKTPSYFKTAHEIAPEDHVKMMAVFNKYVCSSVSKTINLPNSATTEDISKAFLMAMDMGIKGLTVFRDGSKEGIFVNKDVKDKSVIAEVQKAIHKIMEEKQNLKMDDATEDRRVAPKKRGNRTMGATYRVHMQGHNLYITANRNSNGELIELFATVGESKSLDAYHTSGVEDSWAEGLGKMISLALRAGVSPSSIIRNLKNIPSDKPVFINIDDEAHAELIPSPPHAIARVMEEELKYSSQTQQKVEVESQRKGNCEDCGSDNIKFKSPTCYECLSCGFSRCG